MVYYNYNNTGGSAAVKKLFGIVAFIAVVITGIAALMYKKYLKTDSRKGFCGEQPEENKKWLDNTEYQDIYMVSRDDYCLHAMMFDNNSDNWVILVHGYDADGTYMTTYATKLYEEGYSILSIDQRGCGLSGDNETTMGHLEKNDVADWAKKLTEEYNARNIMLLGVSMGAATVMLASAEQLPDTVRCIVEDCGYSSVREQFEHSIVKVLHIPPYPVLWVNDLITRFKKGWSVLKDADCVKAVSRAKVPILFIHGEADDFVPFGMQAKVYEACKRDDKEIITVKDAAHTEAVVKDPELYWNAVLGFMNKHFVK